MRFKNHPQDSLAQTPLQSCDAKSRQNQQRLIWIRIEVKNSSRIGPQQTLNVRRRAIASAQSNELWWAAMQDASVIEIQIFRNYRKAPCNCELPDLTGIRRA